MRAVDRAIYLVFAAAMTFAAARTFYGYMLRQTGGEWSAPLDDVFIHFDYARATARGFPFQWSIGNGYSSGNTSLLYPFVLAAGYLAGFRDASLMIWAGIVACTSVFAFLLASQRLFAGQPAWAKYLCPPAIFAIGALDWSLFSGMEVALFLGIWSGALVIALDQVERVATSTEAPGWRDWALGLWGAALYLTRPEGATSIAALGLMVAEVVRRRRGRRAALVQLARTALPPTAVIVVQALTNRWLTGEFAASGSIVKIIFYNPYMTAQEKLDEYLFLLKYVVFRNTEYHFSDALPYGYIVPALALVPVVFPRTRLVALALWGSIASWLVVVAANGQVRWQNERYTMPAVAWLLLLAALGVAQILAPPRSTGTRAPAVVYAIHAARAAALLGLIALFVIHQEPKMRDQIWFFGRASRNIRDQHITAGRVLREMTPRPKRVLMGDAGALLYASDLPGLDLIGLGGYHDLPFARAGIHGLGATLELIERVAPRDRPDVFAIYPSWWGDLPTWFGRRLFEVPVRGNVICGGAEKVIYRADWHALGQSAQPHTLSPVEQVIDELDVADLVSEREHGYEFPHPSAGFVDAKVLGDVAAGQREMFDAGRRIPRGRSETFQLRLAEGKKIRIIARTAPEHDVTASVKIDGEPIGVFQFERAEGWREAAVEVPHARGLVRVAVTPETGDWVDHHVWAVESQ
ncbi:MAG TPA: hypothetical protein VK550_29805 [Polyangiaceae bacterium]|nr:hypothetical protein [Polyangiaceae bacterium]